MALPKGPPKSPAVPFWLIVTLISLLLILVGGWQAGGLGEAGGWFAQLFTQPRHQGSQQSVDATPDRTAERRAMERWKQAEQEAANRKANDPAADKADTGTPADTAGNSAEGGQDGKDQATGPTAQETAGAAGGTAPADGSDAAANKASTDIASAPVADEKQVKDVPAPKASLDADAPATGGQTDDAWLTDPQAADSAINKELAKHWPLARLRNFLNLQEQARRLVVTVDNLPGNHVPSQLRLTRGVPDLLRVEQQGETITLSERNFARYDAIISFAESLGPKTLGRLYAKFYPLLQHTYEETGFPENRFHDRVIAAIDDMLAAPSVSGPIRLVQPKVLYRFEDPELEALSPGKKIMLRIGPDNAERLKKVLRSWRTALVARAPRQ